MRYAGTVFCLVAMVLVFAGCDHHYDTDYIVDGRLVRLPSGGEDMGVLDHFDVITTSSTKSITGIDDVDGYPFTLLNDSLVVVSIESLDGLNPFVEVYDANGNFITSNDDGGVGTDALIVGDFGGGDYTVLVWSSENGPTAGDYEINVLVSPLGGADLEEMDVGDGIVITDTELFANDDAVTFVFTLREPGSVNIDVVQTSGAADIAIDVIDQRGNQIVFFDPVDIADPSLQAEPLQRGTYLLTISNAMGAAGGFFDLTLTIDP